MASIVRGAAWTEVRFLEAGYCSSGLCPLGCGERDTMHHRLYTCTASAVHRSSCITEGVVKCLAEGTAGEALLERAIPAHPEDSVPRPANDMIIDTMEYMQPFDPATDKLQGRVFMDGSCSPHALPGLWRASWALTLADERGKSRVAVRGTVPGVLPQTAPVAEMCAYGAYLELTDLDPGRTCGYTDCLGVPLLHQLGIKSRLKAQRKLAGLSKQALAHRPADFGELAKVKAHQALGGLEGDPLAIATGNHEVDWEAKEAIKLHGGPSEAELVCINGCLDLAREIAIFAAKMSAAWPETHRHQRVVDFHGIEADGAPRPGHDWVEGGGRHKCRACLRIALGAKAKERLDRRGCQGPSDKVVACIGAARTLGHSLFIGLAGQEPFLHCGICAAWCDRRPHALARPCPGQCPASRRGVAKQLSAGRMPGSDLRFEAASPVEPFLLAGVPAQRVISKYLELHPVVKLREGRARAGTLATGAAGDPRGYAQPPAPAAAEPRLASAGPSRLELLKARVRARLADS